jgi:hypothetical protein
VNSSLDLFLNASPNDKKEINRQGLPAVSGNAMPSTAGKKPAPVCIFFYYSSFLIL